MAPIAWRTIHHRYPKPLSNSAVMASETDRGRGNRKRGVDVRRLSPSAKSKGHRRANLGLAQDVVPVLARLLGVADDDCFVVEIDFA